MLRVSDLLYSIFNGTVWALSSVPFNQNLKSVWGFEVEIDIDRTLAIRLQVLPEGHRYRSVVDGLQE